MNTTHSTHRRHHVRMRVLAIGLLVATLGASSLVATTYISVEPIPSEDVIGAPALQTILSAGYANLERWSERLLNDCGMVQDVIDVLDTYGAIRTVEAGNTRVRVAAGGFEGQTNPAFVFTVDDSGPDGVSAADVDVLDNALGYVLNQGGTAHFSPDQPHAYDFALDYAVVTFDGTLTGLEAKAFFEHLGTIDPALWSGPLAGFTQIDFAGSPTNNSMLFLQPATSKHQFVTGLFAAANPSLGAEYVTVKKNGQLTTSRAGVSFPGNDWTAFPDGDQYLAKLGNASPQLLAALASLRQQHREAADQLVAAIKAGTIDAYLGNQFTCPAL